jgi:SAM-dependent methyltransferase
MSAPVRRLEGELEQIYANRFRDVDRSRKGHVWRVLVEHEFQPYVPAGGTVLDIGAGYCEFINHVKAERRIAIDLNPETARMADPGVEVLAVPFENLAQALGPNSIDLAFASNVFEHVRGPDVLLDILAAIHAALRPGGRLIIMQPNVKALGGRFWDFVDHTLPLTELGMAEALEISGYTIDQCRARFLPYTFKSRLPSWPWLVRAYLAIRPAQWLMGKQMLVVARRP